MNKTFCTLPWVNLSVDPDGSVKPCCISNDYILKEDGTKFNFGYDKLEDIYNSDSFTKIRQQMIDGVEVNGCTRCYVQEKISGTSNRISYKHFNVSKKTTKIENIKIQYFDLRFGNLCNLKCRTCNPTASNQISKEILEIEDPKLREFWNPISSDINSWYKTDTFRNNLNSQLDNVSLLYITGGEPTLNEENKRFLESLVKSNRNEFITIKISTNMTNLNKDFFNLLSKFKKVIFFASIDGYKTIQEYLRYPSNWNQIDMNVQQVLSNGSYNLIATPVIQIGNLNNIVDLFEYFESFNRKAKKNLINIDPILLEFPDQFNIKYLPKEYKLMCWDRIESWYNEKCKYQRLLFKNKLNGIKSKCLEDVDYTANLKKFKLMNGILDTHRNNYLRDCNNELYQLLETI